jgi:threonine aldolase
MFGGSLPHTWPGAAVALHYINGFADRFAEIAAISERLLESLREHRRITIERAPGATNVTILRVAGSARRPCPRHCWPAASRSTRRVQDGGAEFALHTNETILRRKLADIIDAFVAALGETE